MAEKTSNELLFDAMVRHQTYLLRYSGMLRNKVLDVLNKSEGDVADKIRAKLANFTGEITPVEVKRMEALYTAIADIRQDSWKDAHSVMQAELLALAYQEPVTLQGILNTVAPVVMTTVLPEPNLLKSIVTSNPFEGRILKEWAATMAADDIRRMRNAIQLGMTAGESMQDIVKRVIGTTAFNNADGVTEITRRQVQAITRTAVMHISNHARKTFLTGNPDVITMEQFVATLDSRTTPVCRANDGKQYKLGRGPVPPLHFNCRSLRIAVLDGVLLGIRPAKPITERQLVREYASENNLGAITSRDDLPYGTKGDYDKFYSKRVRELVGPVPASTTYQTWLESQSVDFQDDILGKTRAKLFRDGDLKLDKFVNRNGDELTLNQLAKKHKEAFRAAGLDPKDF